ncbi:MAG TPA: Hint domain-containing protein [Bauldia sp.]|nr:Hint domain-containing protein [Bauldia sp.]
MADPSVFAYMYALTVDGSGNYVLVDGDGNSGNGLLTPASLDVSIKDDIQDGPTDRHTVVGDIANDQFEVTRADDLNGNYTFISLGFTNVGPGQNGMIALNQATSTYYFFTNTALDDSLANTALTQESGPLEVCFMPGTMIATPAGEVAVETLRIGDMVRTDDGRDVVVRWIGRQTVAPLFADELRLPVRVKAGALGENQPARDLVLSPDHALLVEGVLVQAGALVNGLSVVRERDVPALFTYLHIETDDHSLILAEGTPAETFIDNVDRARFDNYDEYLRLYPAGRAMAEMDLPRAQSHRQVPAAIRARLADRAARLFGEVAAAA